MDLKAINDLVRQIEGTTALVLLDTLGAMRDSLRSLAQNVGPTLDDVEKAHITNACLELDKAILRLSQRKIRQAHQVAPERAEQLAKVEGLEETLTSAVSAPVLLPEDRKKLS